MSHCARLKSIVARLDAAEQSTGTGEAVLDTRWLVEQVRGWQAFAVAVVDFGDAVRALRESRIDSVVDSVISGYDALFLKPPRGRDG